MEVGDQYYYSHGKLLISGEYFVLDGAKAFAIPTRHGQKLEVKPAEDRPRQLHWTALDHEGNTWLQAIFHLPSLDLVIPDNFETRRLEQLLQSARKLSRDFLNTSNGHYVTTQLEFPGDWGLGSSSTLIHNLAKWAEVAPFELLKHTFGGSGYDIACAGANGPVIYQIENGKPKWSEVSFEPHFTKNLFFVHLGHKQDSREAIAKYRTVYKKDNSLRDAVSKITDTMVYADNLDIFREGMEEHENIISSALGLPTARELHFDDLPGSVKSLGAWGGDMVLIATEIGKDELKIYLKGRGFNTLIPWKDINFAPVAI